MDFHRLTPLGILLLSALSLAPDNVHAGFPGKMGVVRPRFNNMHN